MRLLLAVYLALYFLAVAGAALTVWRSGLIAHLHRGWTLGVFALAVSLGVLLALLSRRRTRPPGDSRTPDGTGT